MQGWGECRGACRARTNSRFCVVLCQEYINVPLHQNSLSAAINKVKFKWILGSASSIQLGHSTNSHIKSSLHFQGPKWIHANVLHKLGLEVHPVAGELLQKMPICMHQT